MKNIVSDKKITDFRDLVNSNSGFIYTTYNDRNGKNQWNLICSCMDWLTVSIRHLQNAPALDKNIDIRVMQMFSLISSIDLVSESVTQLHRVFINPKTLPFSEERNCFSKRIFDEDDNNYFKSIRASFGAHPVNLNQSNSKRFASWPYNSHMNSGELTVNLYSSNVDENDLVMTLNSKELTEFLITRYNYLDVISQKIRDLYNSFTESLKKQVIENRTNPLEQLYILRAESEKRLNNDYYNNIIKELIIIFETEVLQFNLKNIVSDYKISLEVLIDEIKINLQTMKIVDLENNSLLSPYSDLSRELSYELGKFYTWFYNENSNDPLIHYYLERFNRETNFKFNFSIDNSKNLLLLKVKLMLLN